MSTETVGLLGTGARDVHLDFHTAPELNQISILGHAVEDCGLVGEKCVRGVVLFHHPCIQHHDSGGGQKTIKSKMIPQGSEQV